jgi:hypothetical protein
MGGAGPTAPHHLALEHDVPEEDVDSIRKPIEALQRPTLEVDFASLDDSADYQRQCRQGHQKHRYQNLRPVTDVPVDLSA